MPNSHIKRLVIVGGGTAGWITAAVMSRMLNKTLDITLVESPNISSVGVGEATIPPILILNNALGIDNADFMRKTNATIKLGIEFENWKHKDHSYMHAFGKFGNDFPFCGFEQLWLRGRNTGDSTDFWDYSLNYQAAIEGKFAPLDTIPNTELQGLIHAYHFDAGLYANYLRSFSEQRGVTRIEGHIEQVKQDSENGFITSLQLENGEQVEGDLFIDCSGFRGLLIEQTLQAGYNDWSHWLPCDRAVAVQSKAEYPIQPYTKATAHESGWQWRIPLTERTGNGLVYCSQYLDADQAQDQLLENLNSQATTEPKHLRFLTGRRRSQWLKNCVAIGLSSGFLEPLESTSIHLIQTAAIRLLKLFPHNGVKQSEVDEFNRQSQQEFEHIRDFIILHYHATERDDSEFWRYCNNMSIPDTLKHKIDLFRDTGKVQNPTEALFSDVGWHQIMIGQGIMPTDYHPLANAMSQAQLTEYHRNLKAIFQQVVKKLPTHQSFLNKVHGTAH